MRLRDFSIYYKINGIIIGVLLALIIILSIIIWNFTSSLLGRQAERRAFETGSYIAVLSAGDILLDNHYALYERINNTKNSAEDIRYILVTDYAGRILVHTFPNGLPQGLPQTLPPSSVEIGAAHPYQLARYSSNEGNIREITVPIENGAVGFVRIGLSENGIHHLLTREITQIYLAAFIACLLAAVLATRLASVIIKPIHNLSRAADAIRTGNFAVRTAAAADDEVGRLAATFNEMAATLDQKYLENENLLQELKTKEKLREKLISKLFTIQEEERKRISRELHDETGQSVTSLLAFMRVLLSQTTDTAQQELLMHARDVTIGILDNIRKMAVELRPPVLDDHGIAAAILKLTQQFSQQHSIAIQLALPEEETPLSDQISLALYRILQESLTNIAKHSKATAVAIELIYPESDIVLIIKDNGQGFSAKTLSEAHKGSRLGLHGMTERVTLLGGTLHISSEVQNGTVITVKLPAKLE